MEVEVHNGKIWELELVWCALQFQFVVSQNKYAASYVEECTFGPLIVPDILFSLHSTPPEFWLKKNFNTN